MYKIKKYMPLKARIQIYHSLIQSHVNYCSLVWGFSAKSYIEKIFTKQKKGLRAVIPGFINYKYKDGNIPGHTKEFFSEYKILTVHNIIAVNTLIFMQKIRNYSSLLPPSIIKTISNDSPTTESTHESCEKWLIEYNNCYYNKSIFFKGPLVSSDSDNDLNLPPESYKNIKAYKNNIKQAMLTIQSSGEPCDWQNSNFLLYNIAGLRKSCATYRQPVNYTE